MAGVWMGALHLPLPGFVCCAFCSCCLVPDAQCVCGVRLLLCRPPDQQALAKTCQELRNAGERIAASLGGSHAPFGACKPTCSSLADAASALSRPS